MEGVCGSRVIADSAPARVGKKSVARWSQRWILFRGILLFVETNAGSEGGAPRYKEQQFRIHGERHAQAIRWENVLEKEFGYGYSGALSCFSHRPP